MKKNVLGIAMLAMILSMPVTAKADQQPADPINIGVNTSNANTLSSETNIDVKNKAIGIGGGATAAGGNAKSSVKNSNVYTSPLPAAGFVNTTVAGSGPLSVVIADPLIAPFRNGFGKDNLENVIDGIGGNERWENLCNKIDVEGGNTTSFSKKLPSIQWVDFAFAGEGWAPGPGSKSVRSGTYSISIKHGNIGNLLTRISPEAMNDGASVVYVTGLDNYAAKSKTNALSIVGAAVSACTLNVVPAGSIGGGSVENKKTRVSVSFSTYRIVQQPVVEKKVVEKKPCVDLSSIISRRDEWQKKISGCHFLCAKNLRYRVPSAECNIDLYACTRDRKYLELAEIDLSWAIKNYEKGTDTRSGKFAAESKGLYKKAILLQATVLQAQGKKDEAQRHADKYGVESWPSDFRP